MEEMFENKVLDDLYEVRRDGFECIFIKHYGEPEEIQNSRTSENELIETIEKLIETETAKKQILDKLYQHKDDLLGEMCFWEQQYYKLGFVDGMYFKKEMKEQKEIFSNINLKNNVKEDSFFYKCRDNLMEFMGANIWKNRKDYKEIVNKMNEIKTQYSNVRTFLEDRKAIELTKEELNAVLNYISLKEKIEDLEKIEMFKLGLKEGNWL